ncbi:MAG TPA: hypothetical protein VMB34_18440 [Acetobacteraceae bacterium]|nr:hypothetical protein [Acetobacteraceae bacterium]
MPTPTNTFTRGASLAMTETHYHAGFKAVLHGAKTFAHKAYFANPDVERRDENHVGMSGALIVKDMQGNKHHLVTRNSQPEGGRHVEPRLLTAAANYFRERKTGLNYAKVIIYLRDSPCKQCTEHLRQWCIDCATAIVGKNHLRCYFVFNFEYYYCNSAKGKNQYQDSEEAKGWYQGFDSYGMETERFPGNRRYRFLNFRQIDAAQLRDPLQKLPSLQLPIYDPY